jgi:hypothetical protein
MRYEEMKWNGGFWLLEQKEQHNEGSAVNCKKDDNFVSPALDTSSVNGETTRRAASLIFDQKKQIVKDKNGWS